MTLLQRHLDAIYQSYLDSIGDSFADTQAMVDDFAVNLCESPIETLLLKAMAATNMLPCDHFSPWRLNSDLNAIYQGGPEAGGCVLIQPQADLQRYRADFHIFMLHLDHSANVIVECDGHEFHERTKEQVTRDKQRDRYLVGRGFPVLRFSGSEIWADPVHCASQIASHLESACIDLAVAASRAQGNG